MIFGKSQEERQTEALERIADAVEDIRDEVTEEA